MLKHTSIKVLLILQNINCSRQASSKTAHNERETYLGFKFVWAARSLDENFWDGPKIRVPPCSLPPFAGAHVGRAAVVISPHSTVTYTYQPTTPQTILKKTNPSKKFMLTVNAHSLPKHKLQSTRRPRWLSSKSTIENYNIYKLHNANYSYKHKDIPFKLHYWIHSKKPKENRNYRKNEKGTKPHFYVWILSVENLGLSREASKICIFRSYRTCFSRQPNRKLLMNFGQKSHEKHKRLNFNLQKPWQLWV